MRNCNVEVHFFPGNYLFNIHLYAIIYTLKRENSFSTFSTKTHSTWIKYIWNDKNAKYFVYYSHCIIIFYCYLMLLVIENIIPGFIPLLHSLDNSHKKLKRYPAMTLIKRNNIKITYLVKKLFQMSNISKMTEC